MSWNKDLDLFQLTSWENIGGDTESDSFRF